MKMESEWITYEINSEIYDDYDEENISHFEVRGILEQAFRDWNHHSDEGPYSPEQIHVSNTHLRANETSLHLV